MVLGADGSSWFWVIGALKAEGAKVFAAPLQLTSLADDVAALDRTLERIGGRVNGTRVIRPMVATGVASKGEGDGLGMAAGTFSDQVGGAVPRGSSAAGA